jgi:RNA polymerase sigma factor (sigma-70 family)
VTIDCLADEQPHNKREGVLTMPIGLSRAAGFGLQTLFGVGATGLLADAQLLELFVRRRGHDAEDAFAAIVARHGPMVWSVCRRALADPNDAEDAFQVTFLVLARRARSISQRELLPNWLHGVAVRTAKELKAKSARRRLRAVRWSTFQRAEIDRLYRSNESIAEQLDSASRWVDEELAKLPEIFRAAIVLCDLEGKTQEEAARQLGVPQGTVASRLARGREKLRCRLTRRGYTVSPGLIAAALSCEPGAMPAALCSRTVAAAAQVAASGSLSGVVAPSLVTVAHTVSRSMGLAKLVVASAVLAGLTALAAGTGLITSARALDEPSKALPAADDRATRKKSPDALAWVDDLHNADAASKQRLKRCLSSALTNHATVRRAIYDFDFRQEVAGIDNAGEVASTEVRNYRGKVCWRDGAVRYEFTGPPPMPANKKTRRSVVIRTDRSLAFAFVDVGGQPEVRAQAAPASATLWERGYSGYMQQLDPLLFYAKWFRSHDQDFRAFCEALVSIQSAEGEGTIVLHLRREAQDARMEIVCDKKADCLPSHYRIGTYIKGKWVTWADESCDWRQTDGVWFPVHQTTEGYVGAKFTAIKFLDLTIHNLRANDKADVADSALDPALLFQYLSAPDPLGERK